MPIRIFLLMFLNSIFILNSTAQTTFTLPKDADFQYKHEKVKQYDFAKKKDGYWLFEPDSPRPEKANVIVFNHGYGGYNPMIYGKWIKHLVRQGNIVIYPRYQRNLWATKSKKFVPYAAEGIKKALIELENGDHPTPVLDQYAMIGHSYGGVIAANLAVHYEDLKLPKPKVLMMCSPGSGIFKGGVLDSYTDLPEDLKIIIMASVYDDVVGNIFSWKVFNTAIHTPDRILLFQQPDTYGKPKITAHHNESYCIDKEFDSGLRNYTSKRALQVSSYTPIDYNGYWKLFDMAMECSDNEVVCNDLFGNKDIQNILGTWADEQPFVPFNVIHPPTTK